MESRIAEEHWRKGEYADAARQYEISLASLTKGSKKWGEVNYLLGVLNYLQGNMEKAKGYFSSAMESKTRDAAASNFLGVIELNSNPSAARAHFEHASRRGYPQAMHNLANLIKEDEPERAFALYRRASRKDKGNPAILYQLWKLSGRERYRKKYLKASLEVIGEDKEKCTTYGSETDFLDRYKKALQDDTTQGLEQLVTEASSIGRLKRQEKRGLASIVYSIGNKWFSQSAFRKAKDAYLRSLHLDPQPHTWNNLGACEMELEEYEQALKGFKNAIGNDLESSVLALGNLASLASLGLPHMNQPKDYWKRALSIIPQERFKLIDHAKFQVAEASFENTNMPNLYIFKRVPKSHSEALQKESEAILRFHKASAELGLALKTVDHHAYIPKADTLILGRITGNNMLDCLIQRRDLKMPFDDLIELIVQTLAQVRTVGMHSCKDLLYDVHPSNHVENAFGASIGLLTKVKGNSASASFYSRDGLNKLVRAIESNYPSLALNIAKLPPDFYKDNSLKNMIFYDGRVEVLDFEELRNSPFVMDIATALEMGRFEFDREETLDRIISLTNALASDANIQKIKIDDKLIIGYYTAAVHKSLAHHASFRDWYLRLGKEGYDCLAWECIDNCIDALGKLNYYSKEDKSKRLEEALIRLNSNHSGKRE